MVSVALGRARAGTFRLPQKATSKKLGFDLESFLRSAGLGRKIVKFERKDTVIAQGDPSTSVLYIQAGSVRLTVVNKGGKQAVVAILGPGDFCGEGCLAGQAVSLVTATAIAPTIVLVIEKNEMLRVLHVEHEFSDRFISFMLERNIRVEADLVDQLFNSSEKRLARTLLLLARYGESGQPRKTIPGVSQEMLAETVGTTRSRVNFFMNKFRKLGFIKYEGRHDQKGEMQINRSLLVKALRG
jgi:CRP-like cAMP-binding protein